MTLKECTALLAPFVLALRAEFDEPTYRAYHRLLGDVPVKLFEAALDRAGKQGVRFPPSAPELRLLAEQARKELVARHPYAPCAACGHAGIVRLHRAGERPRYGPCACWRRHQAFLAELGLEQTLVVTTPGSDPKQLAAGE